MRLLSNIFDCFSHQFPSDQTIKDAQFLDWNGKAHVDAYLSFYEREVAMDAIAEEMASADNFMSPFFTAPSSRSDRCWEAAHGPSNYKGGLKTIIPVITEVPPIGIKKQQNSIVHRHLRDLAFCTKTVMV